MVITRFTLRSRNNLCGFIGIELGNSFTIKLYNKLIYSNIKNYKVK